jgi:hypothetical protein
MAVIKTIRQLASPVVSEVTAKRRRETRNRL